MRQTSKNEQGIRYHKKLLSINVFSIFCLKFSIDIIRQKASLFDHVSDNEQHLRIKPVKIWSCTALYCVHICVLIDVIQNTWTFL